jgi:hypothetical protein
MVAFSQSYHDCQKFPLKQKPRLLRHDQNRNSGLKALSTWLRKPGRYCEGVGWLTNLQWQFQNLDSIFETSDTLPSLIFIVLDALDECGEEVMPRHPASCRRAFHEIFSLRADPKSRYVCSPQIRSGTHPFIYTKSAYVMRHTVSEVFGLSSIN